MFTVFRRSDVTEVSATITDPDLRITAKRSGGAPNLNFRPTMVRLTLSRHDPDNFTPAVQVHVTGPNVRPDGQPGAQVLGVTYTSASTTGVRKGLHHVPLDEMPSWLACWLVDTTGDWVIATPDATPATTLLKALGR